MNYTFFIGIALCAIAGIIGGAKALPAVVCAQVGMFILMYGAKS